MKAFSFKWNHIKLRKRSAGIRPVSTSLLYLFALSINNVKIGDRLNARSLPRSINSDLACEGEGMHYKRTHLFSTLLSELCLPVCI